MLFGPGHCAGVWAPKEVSYTNMICSAIFMTLTVPANALVIIAVLKDPFRDLKKPFTLLILNLAVTDLIVGALVEPLSVYIHSREARGLSINFAWLSQTAYFLCCTASLLSLAALTVDRYLAIARAVWYRANVRNTRVFFASILVWLLSIVCTSLFFVVGFISYAFVFANIAILATLLIFIFTYAQVFRVLKKQLKNISVMHGGNVTETERAQKRNMMWERRVTQAYLIVLAVFLACYVPSCLMIYLMNMCTSCSCDMIHWFRDMQFILVTINSLLNPYIYAFRLSPLRRALFHIIRSTPCCRSNAVASESMTIATRHQRTTSTSMTNEDHPKPVGGNQNMEDDRPMSPEFSTTKPWHCNYTYVCEFLIEKKTDYYHASTTTVFSLLCLLARRRYEWSRTDEEVHSMLVYFDRCTQGNIFLSTFSEHVSGAWCVTFVSDSVVLSHYIGAGVRKCAFPWFPIFLLAPITLCVREG